MGLLTEYRIRGTQFEKLRFNSKFKAFDYSSPHFIMHLSFFNCFEKERRAFLKMLKNLGYIASALSPAKLKKIFTFEAQNSYCSFANTGYLVAGKLSGVDDVARLNLLLSSIANPLEGQTISVNFILIQLSDHEAGTCDQIIIEEFVSLTAYLKSRPTVSAIQGNGAAAISQLAFNAYSALFETLMYPIKALLLTLESKARNANV